MKIDLRKPDLTKVKRGTIVITSKGFKFERVKLKGWKDLTTSLTWYPALSNTYTHDQVMNQYGDKVPTIEEFKEAETHGVREVCLDFAGKWFWSASLNPNGTGSAQVFSGNDGDSDYVVFRNNYDVSVRLVGR